MQKRRGPALGGSKIGGRAGSGPSPLSRAWRVYLGVSVLFILAYYLLPLPGAAQIVTLILLGLSPLVMFVTGIRVHRPARPGTWYLLLGGVSAFLAGDALWEYGVRVLQSTLLYSVSSACYLVGYILIFAALLLLARERSPDGDRSSLLDAAIVATGTGMLSWTFLAAPYLRDSVLPATERLLLAVYPLVDILLLAVLVRFFLAPGPRVAAYRLLCLGLAALLISDAAYSAERLMDSYDAGAASDVGWSLFYVLWGAAALHPSMRWLTQPAPQDPTYSSRKRMMLLAAASLLAPAALTVQAVRGLPTEIPVLVAGSALLFLLVLARMEGVQRILLSILKERERAETELRASERRFRQLFDQSVDALIVFDDSGSIHDCNQEACRALGYSRDEILNLNVRDVSAGEGLLSKAERRERQREDGTLWQRYVAGDQDGRTVHEGLHRRKDGSTYPIEVVIGSVDYGEERLILASARDITERKRLEDRLRYQASHDYLTGLPNRKLFEERLEKASDRARRNGSIVAVLYLDLDGFKQINDSLGHETGDLLLIEMARRLEASVRPADTIARLGGDEFCVLLEDLSNVGEARETATRMAQTIAGTASVDGKEVRMAASIGVSVGAPGKWEPVSLLREADAAMYRIKSEDKIYHER